MATAERGLLSDAADIPVNSSADSHASLERRFETALDALWLVFQPIVWGGPGRIHGYEALVRSEEPGLRRPLELIAAAERLGRTRDVARTIRTRLADAMLRIPAHARLFVNADHADLDDPQMYDGHDPLARFGPRIVLEITERAALYQIPALQAKLDALRDFGFQLAVDDVDGDEASLAKIGMIDADYVKLDIALVQHVHENRLKKDLVRSVAYVCEDMGRHLIAEGVEHESEHQALLQSGCDFFQGFLFGGPVREPGVHDA